MSISVSTIKQILEIKNYTFSIAMYVTFISQCIDLCKTSGISPMERYACQFSLTVVALGAIGFVAEVFHALEYIKGNPTI